MFYVLGCTNRILISSWLKVEIIFCVNSAWSFYEQTFASFDLDLVKRGFIDMFWSRDLPVYIHNSRHCLLFEGAPTVPLGVRQSDPAVLLLPNALPSLQLTFTEKTSGHYLGIFVAVNLYLFPSPC